MDDKQAQSGSRQRIDKWLFFARAVKSRTLAAKLVEVWPEGKLLLSLPSGRRDGNASFIPWVSKIVPPMLPP